MYYLNYFHPGLHLLLLLVLVLLIFLLIVITAVRFTFKAQLEPERPLGSLCRQTSSSAQEQGYGVEAAVCWESDAEMYYRISVAIISTAYRMFKAVLISQASRFMQLLST